MSAVYDVDTLIVGQGLAGSLLAWELIHQGKQVLVVDDGHTSAASTAAAGLLNPVTGQRLVKTAYADACLAAAHTTYAMLGKSLGGRLVVDKPMLRVFARTQERDAWHRREADPGYRAYLGQIVEAVAPVYMPLGGGYQSQTGYLDTRRLLDAMRDYLVQTGRYRQARLDYAAIDLAGELVAWEGIRARHLIFCEGYKTQTNPWFSWLPFQPAKGEILSLQIQDTLPDVIINAGKWLMPRGNGHYRLGATYEHEVLDETPTDIARTELLDAFARLFQRPPAYRLIGHQAGVRPNTRDKMPFLGLHPQYPQLGVFNGFGSKGSMLIPWYARHFAQRLCHGTALPADVDIQRIQGMA